MIAIKEKGTKSMIHTDRAIVVEGKYDKIKLSGMIDGVIVCTGGLHLEQGAGDAAHPGKQTGFGR